MRNVLLSSIGSMLSPIGMLPFFGKIVGCSFGSSLAGFFGLGIDRIRVFSKYLSPCRCLSVLFWLIWFAMVGVHFTGVSIVACCAVTFSVAFRVLFLVYRWVWCLSVWIFVGFSVSACIVPLSDSAVLIGFLVT
jgi:hypothetical protein